MMKDMSPIAYYCGLAKSGTKQDVDILMKGLKRKMTLADSKFIDFALGRIETEEGIARMEYYLFFGTQIQRNYSALFFGRRSDYALLRRAYEQGLIDGYQAFSR